MIGKLKGKVEFINQNQIIIDVNGVGYRVLVPVKNLVSGMKIGDNVELFIHTYVREDIIQLFGFLTSEELSLFEKFLSVSGIGAKLALSVVSSGKVEEIISAVINADVDYFQNIPGIGKKTAQRIIVELKSVFGDKKELDLLEAHLPKFQEAYDALKHFGFSKEEAKEAVRQVENSKELTSEQLIKHALRLLAK